MPYFHKDASRVYGKPWIYNLKMRYLISEALIHINSSRVPFNRSFNLSWGIRAISTDLSGADKVCGFSQCFRKCGFLLISQGELQVPTLEAI